jgi:polysaccharide biosynthesis/export protein
MFIPGTSDFIFAFPNIVSLAVLASRIDNTGGITLMKLAGSWAISILACLRLAYPQTDTASHAIAPEVVANLPSSYVLGPNDQLSLIVDQLQDGFTDRTFRIDGQGDITIPLIGRVHAGGLTASEFEEQLKTRFGVILKVPDIVVNVTEFASQPVSVQGAVNAPGIHQLAGRKTLFELLSLSEGLRPDAGTRIVITRDLKWGSIPLPVAGLSATGQYSVATVRAKNVMNASEENIAIMPGDTIFVPRADVVYAVGSVTKPAGFPIGESETLSALQVISLAEGMVKTAAGDKAKILRLTPDGRRTEIPINLNSLMAGKGTDIPLQADDILFVPNSSAKSIGFRTVDAIVNAASGLAILSSHL